MPTKKARISSALYKGKKLVPKKEKKPAKY